MRKIGHPLLLLLVADITACLDSLEELPLLLVRLVVRLTMDLPQSYCKVVP